MENKKCLKPPTRSVRLPLIQRLQPSAPECMASDCEPGFRVDQDQYWIASFIILSYPLWIVLGIPFGNQRRSCIQGAFRGYRNLPLTTCCFQPYWMSEEAKLRMVLLFFCACLNGMGAPSQVEPPEFVFWPRLLARLDWHGGYTEARHHSTGYWLADLKDFPA